jgi:hypothetical protein
MKKVLIAILGLLTLAAASSFATGTRTLVMGDNNMIMVDDANMFMFPGRVNNYPNLALGEFGDDEIYNFGLTWQFKDENPWTIATFVSYYPQFGPWDYEGRDMADFPYFGSGYYSYPWWWYDYAERAPASPDQLSNDYPRRMQVIFGHKLGGNNFGFSLDVVRASWKADNDSTALVRLNTKASQSFSQYNFGLGLTEAGSGKWDVGLNFMMGSWTNEDELGRKYNEPSGFYDFDLSGRYFMVRNPKITLVPHAQVGMGKRGVKDFGALPDTLATDDLKIEETRTSFDLGCGMNYTLAPNVLAVLDFGFSYYRFKGESSGDTTTFAGMIGEHKETYFTFPYLKIGFEGEVFSWMDIRAGGYTDLWSSSDKIQSDFMVDQTWNTPSTNTYLGFGFNWGKLYLDTYTDPTIILDGFNFISGSTQAEDLNWQVSMVYEMF